MPLRRMPLADGVSAPRSMRAHMKNARRRFTREKVIRQFNGMFQIKKKEQDEIVSVATFLDTSAFLSSGPHELSLLRTRMA